MLVWLWLLVCCVFFMVGVDVGEFFGVGVGGGEGFFVGG